MVLSENDLFAAIRGCAARHGLEAHGIRVLDESDGRSIELHIEVADTLKLEEAHRQATEFENDLRLTVPQITAVVTHIEPGGDMQSGLESQTPADASRETALLETAIRRFAQTETTAFQTHNLKVQAVGDELHVSFHCTQEAQTPITQAHELTQRLESFLRAEVPHLGRVVIHVEPDA